MYELGLNFAHCLHRVHHIARPYVVCAFRPLGVVVGSGRDERSDVENVMRAFHEFAAGVSVAEVAPHRLHALAVNTARRSGEISVF